MSAFEDGANIWTACADGDMSRVEYLLGLGMNVNVTDEYGYAPIYFAASYSHIPLIEYLIGRGANVNICDPDGDTPILACEDPVTFELLEKHGADITVKNNEGEGLVEKAVEMLEEENIEMVDYLITRQILPADFKETVGAKEEADTAGAIQVDMNDLQQYMEEQEAMGAGMEKESA